MGHVTTLGYTGTSILPNTVTLPTPNRVLNSPNMLTVYNCPSNPLRDDRWWSSNYAYNYLLTSYTPGTFRMARIRAGRWAASGSWTV